MVVAEHQHVRSELDLGRARCEVAEGGEWIPVAGPAAIELRCGDADVLAAGQVVVAEAISSFRDGTEVLDGGLSLPLSAASRRQCDDRRADRQLEPLVHVLSPR